MPLTLPCRAENCPDSSSPTGAPSSYWEASSAHLYCFTRCGHLLSRLLEALKSGEREGIRLLSPSFFCWASLSAILCWFPLHSSSLPNSRCHQPSITILISTSISVR